MGHIKINWNQFKINNPNREEAFENLCYHLFCRRFEITGGIFEYKNQIGIETEPISDGNDIIGFQAKYFENQICKKKIIESIEKAKERNPKLTKIIFYINQTFSEGKSTKKASIQTSIEDKAQAYNIKLEWIVPSYFEMLLSQPCNNDLAQIYFGVGDEYGFIQSCCDPVKMTLLNSKEYLNIPFTDSLDEPEKDLKDSIILSKEKTFLLVGHPGSGKSIYMHKLLQQFGGLDKGSVEDMRKVIDETKALPMLINLKECYSDSLENIVRNQKADYKLDGSKLGIIYLLDGLDELDQEKADKVLAYIEKLVKIEYTKKVIISCRSGNKNRIKAKLYFSQLREYVIPHLDISYIQKYFDIKDRSSKKELFKEFEKLNPNLINKITDIILIKLLWDTMHKLDDSSSIIDLLEEKISILLNDPYHKKNIDDLNLLDPKQDSIYELNKDIAYEFFKKYQFRFSEKEIQNVIVKKFPRIDYKSINHIVDYLVAIFFEDNLSSSSARKTYIYRHRIYQDYFSLYKLKDEYEKDLKELRRVRVLSNQEFFRDLFLPFLKKEYLKSNNLCRLIELNLIDMYLGQHSGWSADDPYYLDSSNFILALATQEDSLFEQLLDNDTLQLKKKILIETLVLEDNFRKWEKDKSNYYNNNLIKDIWENSLARLIEGSVILWKYKKFNFSKELLTNIHEVQLLFDKYGFCQEEGRIRSPFGEKIESWFFIRIVIEEEDVKNVFDDLVRGNYKKNSDREDFFLEERGNEKLIKSFFRTFLRQNEDVTGFFEILDIDEKNMFLSVLATEEFLPFFLRNKGFREIIEDYIKVQEFSEENYYLLFYKRFFEIPLSQEEGDFIQSQLIELQKKESIYWRYRKIHFKYSLLSYAGSVYNFEKLREAVEKGLACFYGEFQLYAATFNGFIQMLEGRLSINDLLREYLFCIRTYDKYLNTYLQKMHSFLWAYIIKYSEASTEDIAVVIKFLLQDDSKISTFSFLHKLFVISKELFIKVVNESEIENLGFKIREKGGSFPALIDHFLGLSAFYSGINSKKSEEYIATSINEGILRHGWRKDPIVSYNLTESLEILLRKNWLPKKNILEYTRRVFDLALRVADITDGKGTWRGPYNVIELIANYDIEFAETLKKKLCDKERFYNTKDLAITSVIMGKVKLGLPYDVIEKDMEEYSTRYDHKNKDGYEQKFKVYLTLAQSQLYTSGERKLFFDKAYGQIEEMKSKDFSHYLRDSDFIQEKIEFEELCKQYNKKVNVIFENKELEDKKKNEISEEEFILNINEADQESTLRDLYTKLKNDDNGIILKSEDSWRTLVKKTVDIMGTINLFIEYLGKNKYPHTDYWSSNSKYFKYGIAEALGNIDTKEEMLKYLYEKLYSKTL